MRVWIQHERFLTYHCLMFYQNRDRAYCSSRSWVYPIDTVLNSRYSQHGPQIRRQIKDGSGSVHFRSATYTCANVQVLLLHSLLMHRNM